MHLRLSLLAALSALYTTHAAHCPDGQTEMSVERAEGVFCVEGHPVCVADVADGHCPGPQPGLELGSHCGVVASGVYGCKMNTEESPETQPPEGSNCGDGESPISVEGAEGVFCAQEPVCVADRAEGACPGPQDGLEHGSHCGVVASGVYGCKKNTGESGEEESTHHHHDNGTAPSNGCADGESPISVEGVEGVFCVAEPVCVADRAEGACPDPQEGLEYGAHCGIVASGVYGCKENMASSTHWPGSDEGEYNSNEGSGSEEGIIESGDTCGEGESPMSVEGVEGVFCAVEPVCVAHNAEGACPEAQEGLENGAHCGIVASGVYGCKEGMAPMNETSSGSWDFETGSMAGSYVKEGSIATGSVEVDCTDNEAGSIPVNVEGVGTFCAAEPICSGDVLGNCPPIQEGLDVDSVCANVHSNSFGCVLP